MSRRISPQRLATAERNRFLESIVALDLQGMTYAKMLDSLQEEGYAIGLTTLRNLVASDDYRAVQERAIEEYSHSPRLKAVQIGVQNLSIFHGLSF